MERTWFNQADVLSTPVRPKVDVLLLKKKNVSIELSNEKTVEIPDDLANKPLAALAARLLQELMLSGVTAQLNDLVKSAKPRLDLISSIPKIFCKNFQSDSIA